MAAFPYTPKSKAGPRGCWAAGDALGSTCKAPCKLSLNRRTQCDHCHAMRFPRRTSESNGHRPAHFVCCITGVDHGFNKLSQIRARKTAEPDCIPQHRIMERHRGNHQCVWWRASERSSGCRQPAPASWWRPRVRQILHPRRLARRGTIVKASAILGGAGLRLAVTRLDRWEVSPR